MFEVVVRNLSEYPKLKSFIESSPPQIQELAGDMHPRYSYARHCRLTNARLRGEEVNEESYIILSRFQILSIYGLVAHIRALHTEKEEIVSEIRKDDYFAIRLAAHNGHLELLKYLLNLLTPEERINAIKTDDCDAIKRACLSSKNSLEIIEYLETVLTPREQKHIAMHRDGSTASAMEFAACAGNFQAFLHFQNMFSSRKMKSLIKRKGYRLISWAALGGKAELLAHIFQKLSGEQWFNERKYAVKAQGFLAIYQAASNGDLNTIKGLESYLNNKEKKSIGRHMFESEGIKKAAKGGHLDVIKYMFENYTHNVSAKNSAALILSDREVLLGISQGGHITTLQYLGEYFTSEERMRVIGRNSTFDGFAMAAGNNHLPILQYLWDEVFSPELRESAVGYKFYAAALHLSLVAGHINVVKFLLEKLTLEKKKEFFKKQLHQTLNPLLHSQHREVIRYVIRDSSLVFDYAESLDEEIGEKYVYPLVSEKMIELESRHQKLFLENPTEVFELRDMHEVELCVYMLRNLIRRGVDHPLENIESLDKNIAFLISIPSVAHVVFEMCESDDKASLFKFSRDIGNDRAFMVLQEARRNAGDLNDRLPLSLATRSIGGSCAVFNIDVGQLTKHSIFNLPKIDSQQSLTEPRAVMNKAHTSLSSTFRRG